MKLNTLLISFIFLLLTGCSSLSVNYDYNKKINFSTYKAYSWLPFPKDAQVNQFNRARFTTAVDDNLAGKGFIQNTSNADFLIATHYGKESKVDITNWGYSYAPNNYYGGYGYRYNRQGGYAGSYATSSGVSVYEYEQGTLIIDFIDTKSKQLIWRATAKGIVSPASTPEKQTQKINDAVKEILNSFPPKNNSAEK